MLSGKSRSGKALFLLPFCGYDVMKIVFLPNYFTPEQAASSYIGENIREAYAEAGFDMVLYTPVPTRGITEEVREEYKKRLYEEQYNGKLIIHRFPMMREGKNPVQRAFRYFLCICKQVRNGCREKDADVFSISSTPPINGLMFSRLRKKTKGKIIYNLQDIFPDSLVNTGLTHRGSLLWKIGRKIEDKTYKNADLIVVISEDFKRNIMAKGVPEDKIVIIRNWVDEEAVVNVPREKNILFDLYDLDRSKFYICYSGNIGHTQNMEMLLDVAKSLKESADIAFVIIGDGAARNEVADRVEKEKLTNVKMLPFQPYERISEVFSLGNVGLIISKSGVGNNSVPSKTWSIMSAERPILASFDKGYEVDRVISESGCGICVEADQPDALREAILSLYSNREKNKAMGKNGRKYILENLTKKAGTDKWIEVMKRVTENS